MKDVIMEYNQSYEVTIHKVKSNEDIKFIQECIERDDFKKYIDPNMNSIKLKEYFILCDNRNEYIGIFCSNIATETGIRRAYPNLYLYRRMTRLSLTSMQAVVKYLFEVEKVDKIICLVYSINKPMASIMNRGPFYLEGELKYSYKYNDIITNLLVYSMLKTEYFNLIREYTI